MCLAVSRYLCVTVSLSGVASACPSTNTILKFKYRVFLKKNDTFENVCLAVSRFPLGEWRVRVRLQTRCTQTPALAASIPQPGLVYLI